MGDRKLPSLAVLVTSQLRVVSGCDNERRVANPVTSLEGILMKGSAERIGDSLVQTASSTVGAMMASYSIGVNRALQI